MQGPQFIEQGRTFFKDAISVIPTPSDMVSAMAVANVHVDWSRAEAANGNGATAIEHIIAALRLMRLIGCSQQRTQLTVAGKKMLADLNAPNLPADVEKIVNQCPISFN